MLKPPDLSADAPWKQRFRAQNILYGTPAADNPARGILCTNATGVYQLHAWDTATNALTQVTNKPTGAMLGGLSADGSTIYYLDDQQGDELGHFVRVSVENGAISAPEDISPDLPRYSSWSVRENQRGTFIGFMAAYNNRFHFYIVEKLFNGGLDTARPIYISDSLSSGPFLSFDGDVAVINTTEKTRTTDTSLIAVYTNTGSVIGELRDPDSSITAVAFSPLSDDFRLLATTTRSGFERPLIWNPRTGERRDLPLPDLSGSVEPWGWSPDARRIALCQVDKAEMHLYVYELETDSLHALQTPAGTLGGWTGGSFTPDGSAILTTHEDAAHPRRLVELDAQTGALRRVVLEAGSVAAGLPFRSVTFPSLDGTPIQGWLAVPEGDAPCPLILDVHGGPTAVQYDSYDPAGQTWLDHGFAVLSINYRGSTTFGKDFERAINGRLGELEIEDVAAARDWAVAQGIAEPDSILLTGWSYGGYLTLMGMGKRPDLWAGGMAGIAIADWALMYEDQAEALRGYQRALFGGTPDEKPEAHRQASPITYAEAIRSPLLIIQGSNDTRCPARQMRVYEDKLKALGKDYTLEWFDAGHGALSAELQIAHQESMLRFAYRVLG
jgi:dipeptidyl aminopeptidase/acylaminoacyl peptidase